MIHAIMGSKRVEGHAPPGVEVESRVSTPATPAAQTSFGAAQR